MKHLLFITIAYFGLTACTSHMWEYEPNKTQQQAPIKQSALLVLPLTDERTTSKFMEWSAPLALIPFVPYSKVSIENHPEKSFVHFNGKPTEEVAKSVTDELVAHNLFSKIIYNEPHQKYDYILTGKLKRFRIKSYWSFYGFSLFGVGLWYLGAPAEKIHNDVIIEFTLSDTNGKSYFQKEYIGKTSHLLGFYYNQNKIKFEKAVKQINLNLINDLFPIIKKLK